MKISTIINRHSAVIAAVGLLALYSVPTYAARCEYLIQNEWSTGFVAAVRITNDTGTAINGWSVNWNYTDGSRRTGGWNASVAGNNPYTATSVGWNDRINPGQSIEFGVQGNKGVANSPAQRPSIGGVVCASSTSSASSKSLASSSARSFASSSPTSSSSYGYSSTSSQVPSSSSSSSSWPSLSSSSDAPPSSRSSAMTDSSSSRSMSSSSSNRNHYDAHRAATAPVIDGTLDAVWEAAAWAPIDVFWLGTQPNPTAQDYSGRYKALWDEDYLYLMFDITDDRIFDGTRNALDRYWEDDTVELFIDENKNGGQHGYNTSAWAYHLSTYGDVVDSTTSGAKLLNDHIDMRLVSMGDKHRWEMRVRIYGEDYADWKTNVPLKLAVGKLMGFSACYIDNDGSAQRESMMGSVDTQGHKNNQGYLDASVFGSLRLVE